MQQRIDVVEIYAKALRRVLSARDRPGQPRALPAECPFTLSGTLGQEVDVLLKQIEAVAPND